MIKKSEINTTVILLLDNHDGIKMTLKCRGLSQVKCQAGYRRDPGNPTQDPRWEWRDPALGGGIPPFPPGMKI